MKKLNNLIFLWSFFYVIILATVSSFGWALILKLYLLSFIIFSPHLYYWLRRKEFYINNKKFLILYLVVFMYVSVTSIIPIATVADHFKSNYEHLVPILLQSTILMMVLRLVGKLTNSYELNNIKYSYNPSLYLLITIVIYIIINFFNLIPHLFIFLLIFSFMNLYYTNIEITNFNHDEVHEQIGNCMWIIIYSILSFNIIALFLSIILLLNYLDEEGSLKKPFFMENKK